MQSDSGLSANLRFQGLVPGPWRDLKIKRF